MFFTSDKRRWALFQYFLISAGPVLNKKGKTLLSYNIFMFNSHDLPLSFNATSSILHAWASHAGRKIKREIMMRKLKI